MGSGKGIGVWVGDLVGGGGVAVRVGVLGEIQYIRGVRV
jgi:hypothetical protein